MTRMRQQVKRSWLAASVALFILCAVASQPVPSFASENPTKLPKSTKVILRASSTRFVKGGTLTLTADIYPSGASGPGWLDVQLPDGSWHAMTKISFAGGSAAGSKKITQPGIYQFAVYYLGVKGIWAGTSSNLVKVTVLK